MKIMTLFFVLVTQGFFNIALAQIWQDSPEPIGNLARVWNVAGALPFPIQPPPPANPFPPPTTPLEEINYIAAQWDNNMTTATVPFDVNSPVTEIISTVKQHFVRVYAPGNTPMTGSGPNGSWFMRSEFVRGMTPEQIRDRFALPAAPTMIVNVEFPASPSPSGKDYAIWTGVAGPILGWGNGGALQNRIVADFNNTHYYPNYAFTTGTRDHPQPIGNYALSYAPLAGHGNPGRIASYLDKFVPVAYSDMEYVYTSLDYLNWVNFGPEPLRHALNQISPERYTGLPFVVIRNAILFADDYLNRNNFPTNCCCCPEARSCSDVEIRAVYEYGKDYKEGSHPGFHYHTTGVVGDFNKQVGNDLNMGVNAAYFGNTIHFQNKGGSANLEAAMGGLYANYKHCRHVVDGLISLGYYWSKARRAIEFLGVDRKARSRPKGFDVGAHLQYCLNLSCCRWNIAPLARVSYFYVGENKFRESRAESLNLHVHHFDLQLLRTNFGAKLMRSFCLGSASLTPEIQLGWLYDCFLNNSIGAELAALGGAFSVKGFRRNRNSLFSEIKLDVSFSNDMTLTGCYSAEIGKYFVAQTVEATFNWKF